MFGETPMSRSTCHSIAVWAAAALGVELYVGIGMWFNPGWANLRRGRQDIQLIWPAGLSAHAAAVLLTASVSLWAVWAGGSEPESGRAYGRAATAVWFVLTGV